MKHHTAMKPRAIVIKRKDVEMRITLSHDFVACKPEDTPAEEYSGTPIRIASVVFGGRAQTLPQKPLSIKLWRTREGIHETIQENHCVEEIWVRSAYGSPPAAGYSIDASAKTGVVGGGVIRAEQVKIEHTTGTVGFLVTIASEDKNFNNLEARSELSVLTGLGVATGGWTIKKRLIKNRLSVSFGTAKAPREAKAIRDHLNKKQEDARRHLQLQKASYKPTHQVEKTDPVPLELLVQSAMASQDVALAEEVDLDLQEEASMTMQVARVVPMSTVVGDEFNKTVLLDTNPATNVLVTLNTGALYGGFEDAPMDTLVKVAKLTFQTEVDCGVKVQFFFVNYFGGQPRDQLVEEFMVHPMVSKYFGSDSFEALARGGTTSKKAEPVWIDFEEGTVQFKIAFEAHGSSQPKFPRTEMLLTLHVRPTHEVQYALPYSDPIDNNYMSTPTITYASQSQQSFDLQGSASYEENYGPNTHLASPRSSFGSDRRVSQESSDTTALKMQQESYADPNQCLDFVELQAFQPTWSEMDRSQGTSDLPSHQLQKVPVIMSPDQQELNLSISFLCDDGRYNSFEGKVNLLLNEQPEDGYKVIAANQPPETPRDESGRKTSRKMKVPKVILHFKKQFVMQDQDQMDHIFILITSMKILPPPEHAATVVVHLDLGT